MASRRALVLGWWQVEWRLDGYTRRGVAISALTLWATHNSELYPRVGCSFACPLATRRLPPYSLDMRRSHVGRLQMDVLGRYSLHLWPHGNQIHTPFERRPCCHARRSSPAAVVHRPTCSPATGAPSPAALAGSRRAFAGNRRAFAGNRRAFAGYRRMFGDEGSRTWAGSAGHALWQAQRFVGGLRVEFSGRKSIHVCPLGSFRDPFGSLLRSRWSNVGPSVSMLGRFRSHWCRRILEGARVTTILSTIRTSRSRSANAGFAKLARAMAMMCPIVANLWLVLGCLGRCLAKRRR